MRREVGIIKGVAAGATFSDDDLYRTELYREMADGPAVLFIGLNPSIAGGLINDPTIVREMGFAKSWGKGVLWKGNLFDFRSTDPSVMRKAAKPCSEGNDLALLAMAKRPAVDLVIAAWGPPGALHNRDFIVRKMFHEAGIELHAIAFTDSGYPRHPLYLKGDLLPKPYPFSKP